MESQVVDAEDLGNIGDEWLDADAGGFSQEDALLEAIMAASELAPEPEPTGRTLDLSGAGGLGAPVPVRSAAAAAAAAAADNGVAAAAAVVEYSEYSAASAWRTSEPTRRHGASSAQTDGDFDLAPGLVQQEAARSSQASAGQASPKAAAHGRVRALHVPWRGAALTIATLVSMLFWGPGLWHQDDVYLPVAPPPQLRRPTIRNPLPDIGLDVPAGNGTGILPGTKLSGVIGVQWSSNADVANITAPSLNASDSSNITRGDRGRRKSLRRPSQLG